MEKPSSRRPHAAVAATEILKLTAAAWGLRLHPEGGTRATTHEALEAARWPCGWLPLAAALRWAI